MKRKCEILSLNDMFSRNGFVVFICVIVSICLLPIRSYAATSLLDGYKKTADLGDIDRSDAHQKNYQQANKSTDASFLYKTAEWTNKDAREAKITLTAQESIPKETRSAVYAFNICEGHGFSKDIAERNIKFLLKNFDRVDIIRTGLFNDETIYTMKNIKSFDDIKWPSVEAAMAAQGDDINSVDKRISNAHRNVGLYDGLRKYLKDYDPTFIYVSFDMFYVAQLSSAGPLRNVPQGVTDLRTDIETIPASELQDPEKLKNVSLAHGVPETMDEDCFDILKRYKEAGRYFSMACDYDGEPITKDGGTYVVAGDPENLVKVNGKAEQLGRERFFYSANVIAALANPAVWPGREAAKRGLWNGESYRPVDPVDSELSIAEAYSQKVQGFKGIAPDYPYNKDFETMDVPVAKHFLRITDTVADAFEIISATSENPKAIIKIDGNTVTASVDDYDGRTPLAVTIKVKLKNQKEGSGGEGTWVDTSNGPAKAQHLVDGKEIKARSVDSPKLFVKDKQPKQNFPFQSGPLTPEPSKPASPGPAPSKPEPRKPIQPKPEPSKPTPPKPAPSKPALSKPAPPKPASPKPAPPKPASSKPAPSKPELRKPIQPEPEPPKSIPPKPAPSKPVSKQAPAKSKRLPGTEDKANPWMWVGIGTLGVVGIVGARYMRKKERD